MDWGRFLLAVIVAGLLISLTDWFFFGIWFHERYLLTPEIWRKAREGEGETKKIIYSALLGALSCAVFIFVCAHLRLLTLRSALHFALAAWVMAPLPLVVTNILWIKMDPRIAISHSLGWLARFCVAAVVAVEILKPR